MSDEPKQTSNWTGEEKLRVVLEAMRTSAAQVVAKYAKHGLDEEQFQVWRQRFIERGGEIFAPKQQPAPVVRSSSRHRNRSPVFTFFATFSILVNLAAAALVAVIHFELFDLSPWLGDLLPKMFPKSASARSGPDAKPSRPPDNGFASRPKLPTDLTPPIPVTTPSFGGEQLARGPGIVSEVEICGVRGRGNKIVFVVDLNDYMRTEPAGQTKYELLRDEVRKAIFSLSEKSFFNVILFNGISRLHLFENKLALASASQKHAADKWLAFSTRGTPNGVPPRFSEIDLEPKPQEGVVGPLRALDAALSFAPDLIYVVTGDCSSLRPDDFSAYELSGVKVSQKDGSPAWEGWRRETDATRLTLAKWLQSDSIRPTDLKVSDAEIDASIAHLAISMPVKPLGSPAVIWPWKDMYAKFKLGLKQQIPDLAATHMVLSLPAGSTWPSDLEYASREFAQLSGGSFNVLDATFFSSPAKP